MLYGLCFNSLQTGKGGQSLKTMYASELYKVSIPFKRERGVKARRIMHTFLSLKGFQFPSNGKGGSKKSKGKVSNGTLSFNSLQTGKGGQSRNRRSGKTYREMFQFPSNGKGGSKLRTAIARNGERLTPVSIPFKRERGVKVKYLINLTRTITPFQFPSNGKGGSKSEQQYLETVMNFGFNSLQTGKGGQSDIGRFIGSHRDYEFQFPSNGKGGSK